jgi:photosystem II stability/assembly factor-like uncharacterized protein
MRLAFIIIVISGLYAKTFSQSKHLASVNYFQQPSHLSIRALQACSKNVVWFAANRGVYGFTRNKGKTWHIDSIGVDGYYPEFRSLWAFNDSTVLLLSVDSPAYLFKTTNYGKSWKCVYTSHEQGVFFDAMYFKDTQYGIAVSDPSGGCFKIITTNNGGETWQQLLCEVIPSAHQGEACFASSNSIVWWQQQRICFATGGNHARLFVSDNNGQSFNVMPTPMISGSQLTGIFSIAWADSNTGFIGGGNYQKNDSAVFTLYKTNNGGHNWTPVLLPDHAFVSCIKLRKTKTDVALFITGHQGTYSLLNNEPTEWLDTKGMKLKYYTLSLSDNGRYVWLAGSKGKMARIKIH